MQASNLTKLPMLQLLTFFVSSLDKSIFRIRIRRVKFGCRFSFSDLNKAHFQFFLLLARKPVIQVSTPTFYQNWILLETNLHFLFIQLSIFLNLKSICKCLNVWPDTRVRCPMFPTFMYPCCAFCGDSSILNFRHFVL